jgi:co-chaperonin GroES (HSP10)
VVKSDTASVVKEGVVTVVGSPEMSPWSGEWLPTYVKEGDKVLFNGNYFTEVTVNNETLYIGKESQLIAILD